MKQRRSLAAVVAQWGRISRDACITGINCTLSSSDNGPS
jgi:hypothetical protein